jgi:hypothetical protein
MNALKNAVLCSVVLLCAIAFADVGAITTLEGAATRLPKGGAAIALKEGSKIELGDTLTVTKGALKLELTDGSVIALGEKSVLVINEAEFEGQERKGFSGFLKSGSLWTKVKKAIGGAKFEVTTDRAVAGVRGTIFRIDADSLVKAAKGKGRKLVSIVRVVEGVVNVHPTKALMSTFKGSAPKGPRTEVPGPKEVTLEEWEAKFVDLQKDTQVTVGADLFEQAQFEEAAKADAFSKWLEKNQ